MNTELKKLLEQHKTSYRDKIAAIDLLLETDNDIILRPSEAIRQAMMDRDITTVPPRASSPVVARKKRRRKKTGQFSYSKKVIAQHCELMWLDLQKQYSDGDTISYRGLLPTFHNVVSHDISEYQMRAIVSGMKYRGYLTTTPDRGVYKIEFDHKRAEKKRVAGIARRKPKS